MEKRVILAVVLSILIIITFQHITAKNYHSQSPAEQTGLVSQQIEPGAELSSLEPSAQKPMPSGAKDVVVETGLFKLVFTTSGARIKSFQLKKYDGVELVSLISRENQDYPLTVVFPGRKDLSGINLAIYKPDKKLLLLNDSNKSGSIKFVYLNNKGFKITKRYTFSYDSYVFDLGLTIDREHGQTLKDKVFLIKYGPGITQPDTKEVRRVYKGPVVRIQQDPGVPPIIKREKYGRDERSQFVTRRYKGDISWISLQDKYFIAALIPFEATGAAIIEKDEQGQCSIALEGVSKPEQTYNVGFYLGPKHEKKLKALNIGLEEIIDYGFFGPIARLLAVVLNIFYQWTHNYGYAIILLAFATKIIFYPLTHRSFEAMRKMQEDMKVVQPELDALKGKYKDNPQKLNKETMELYRKTGVNPLAGCRGGCLPLLLQMPVFIALYVVLYNAITLRGAPFVWWITDLSVKDPYYVLPILMGVSTLVQQKVTGLGKTGADTQQAKMMMWMMPLFLIWIFAKFPSGVVLYWFAFNVFTSIQQLLITKVKPPKQVLK
ncbi:MAG: membrane protein insertase YidC [Candidatus Omnitrophota bacterium]|nr:membrane protein insertase YidC [Candidatus Omnitrophota bacterium]